MPVQEITCEGGLAESNAIGLAGNLKATKLEWFLVTHSGSEQRQCDLMPLTTAFARLSGAAITMSSTYTAKKPLAFSSTRAEVSSA